MKKLVLVVGLVALASIARAQEQFSLFVASDIQEVRRMLAVADLRKGDVVLDLGSGDGRIVLEAARMHPHVQGRGVDIDAKLVRESTAQAQAEKLADRVRFVHQDVFETNLSEATVITMWLFPELMRMLRPKILAEATPGTRVISRVWDMGTWTPDRTEDTWPYVYLWVVPARVAGSWTWDLALDGTPFTYSALIEQRFQDAEGVVRVGNRRGIFEKMTLRGKDISFALTMTVGDKSTVVHTYKGIVAGDTIEGTVSVQHKPHQKPYVLPWRAVRGQHGTYLSPVK